MRKHKPSADTDKFSISDDKSPQLTENLSDLALQIFDQYGLVRRYQRQNKLHKLEKLRAHILEREKNEQKQKEEESKKTTFSLEMGQEQSKEAMAVSVYNPQLAEIQKVKKSRRATEKSSPKLLKGKEFKF